MWMVDPRSMCRKHLLGEHVELHMLASTLRRGYRIDGFLEQRILEPASIIKRHNQLVCEMQRRGYEHTSPLTSRDIPERLGSKYPVRVDPEESERELRRRCDYCFVSRAKPTR